MELVLCLVGAAVAVGAAVYIHFFYHLTDKDVSVSAHSARIPEGKRLVLGGLPARDIIVVRYESNGQVLIETLASATPYQLIIDQPVTHLAYDAYEIKLTLSKLGMTATWSPALKPI